MTPSLNLLDPEVHEDPYAYYEELQRTARVFRVEPFGFHGVARYDDVAFVLKNPDKFSSRAMSSMLGELNPVPDARVLIATDPPVHTRLRSLVNRGFTPRSIAALEPRVREIMQDVLDRLTPGLPFDVVANVAIPLPVTVIAEMLGVPSEDQQDFKRWSDDIVKAVDGVMTDAERGSIRTSICEFQRYFSEILERRRSEPASDVLSTILRAEEEGMSLSDDDVLALSTLILVAGNETTTSLIGNALIALSRHPGELEKVRADPGLIPRLVEETLRYDNPVQCLFRQANEDVAVGDETVPAGAMVMPFFAAANRDAEHFPDPHRFDVTRNAVGHFGFGFGAHFCLGAALARLEAKVALEALLPVLDPLEIIEPVERIDSVFLRGPKRLVLQLTGVSAYPHEPAMNRGPFKQID